KCPLLDRGKLLNDAKAVLVQVSGGENMTLFEVQMVMEEVAKHVGKETQILFGTGTDKRLGSALAVTILSSIPGPEAENVAVEVEEEAGPAPVSLGMTSEPAAVPPAPPEASAKLPEPEKPVEELAPPVAEPSAPDLELPEEESLEEEIFEDGSDDLEDMTGPIGEGIVDESVQEDESLVFEPLDEEEAPAYDPDPLPPVLESEEPVGDDVSEEINPIARAVEDSQGADTGSIAPIQPSDLGLEPIDEEEDSEADRVEAVTESSQKITLTRVVGSGNTGRIKTRNPGDGDGKGPVMPPTKPPAIPAEDLGDEEVPDDVKQQQELLQLEPVKSKGRFAKTDPTIVDGEDLDVPTFLRKKK
ncbi:MAG: hypothetical protein AAGF67_02870, partial [Verrucomicrobiota bacterium]